MDLESVGNKIRQLRRSEGLTLEELASILNIKKNMLSNYELGKNSISAKLLTKIADYFDVTLDSLVDRVSLKLSENTNDDLIECPIYAHLHSDDFSDGINKQEILHTVILPDYYIGNGKYFGIKIKDDSLNLRNIFRGITAIAKKQDIAHPGDLVIYVYNGNEHYGIYTLSDDNIIISPCSSDDTYSPRIFNVKDDKFKLIGKIVMILGPIQSI